MSYIATAADVLVIDETWSTLLRLAGKTPNLTPWKLTDFLNLAGSSTVSNPNVGDFTSDTLTSNGDVLAAGDVIAAGDVTATGNVTGANLSGTNTGNVTIGTANGLSVVGQAISMAAAGVATTGVLTAGAQVIGGVKNFNSIPVAAGLTAQAAGPLTFTSNQASGGTPAFTWAIDSSWSGAVAFQWTTNGIPYVQLDGNGNFLFARATLTGDIYRYQGNSTLAIFGKRDAADTGTDVLLSSQTARSAGLITGIANNGTPVAGFDWNGAVQLNIAGGSRPTAGVAHRGKLHLIQGGAGVADILSICIKDNTDTYVWKVVTLS